MMIYFAFVRNQNSSLIPRTIFEVRFFRYVAVQAEQPHWRVEEEGEPLCGGRRLRLQGDQDQRTASQNYLVCGFKNE